jgi:NADH-quinone oxidoreductase subunit L
MVFYGEPRAHLHGHDAGNAMKVALIPLAIGTLTTWLLAGPFSEFLSATLPFHEIEALPTLSILEEVVTAPATIVALVVIVLGLLAWSWRKQLSGLAGALKPVAVAAENSFGFEAINRGIVRATQSIAERLRSTQTGYLNWNVAGILFGLIVVLAVLVWGA